MDTIKIENKKNTKMVAHKGVSGIERENTIASFLAAANRSYYGIEADAHLTSDGKFVIIHDSNPCRMSDVDMWVEDERYDEIRKIALFDTDGQNRCDLKIPNVDEYIKICKRYEKVAVLELKNPMPKEAIENICDIIKQFDYLDNTIFISFDFENLICVRELYPDVSIQFLTCECDSALIEKLKMYNIYLDIEYSAVTKELVDDCHNAGILVGCWIVDDIKDAQALVNLGVDFITTDILE